MARKVYIQQSRKGGLAALIILVLVLVILGLTNPSMADFRHHLQTQAQAQAENKGGGLLSGLAGGIAGLSSAAYYRQNYLIFSLFKEKGSDRTAFVGFGKFIFIKTAK